MEVVDVPLLGTNHEIWRSSCFYGEQYGTVKKNSGQIAYSNNISTKLS